MKSLFTILFISLFSVAFAQEDPVMDNVLKQLKLSWKDIEKDFTIKKTSPVDKNTFIYAVTVPKPDEGYIVYDLYVLLVNDKGEIISKYYEEEALLSDAINLTGISTDTAPYELAPGIRAFGITTGHYLHSRPNPYIGRNLNLFFRKDDKILKVLNDFSIYAYHGEASDTDPCSNYFSEEENILIIQKNQTDGFNDILVKSKVKETQYLDEDGDCGEKIDIKKASNKLIYNKEKLQYQVLK